MIKWIKRQQADLHISLRLGLFLAFAAGFGLGLEVITLVKILVKVLA